MKIRRITVREELNICADVIRRSNETVAARFGITRENAPTNPAFITAERLLEMMLKGSVFFGLYDGVTIIGTVAIERSKEDNALFYLERLAVLPEFRHNGYGRQLMDHACDEVRTLDGVKVSIGIINENLTLKNWYQSYGFEETGTRRYEHLPFEVCFMSKDLV